jgi:N-methylhydantoinase A
MSTRIGVDVGGTFTDLIFFDEDSHEVLVGKGRSNPAAVDEAVRQVVDATVDRDGVERAAFFLHGTTVGLNALLERKGARVGVLTTEGFRDILEQRRQLRVDERGERVWDHLFKTPEPLVARPLRVGIPERVTADGSIRTPLDEAAVRSAAEAFSRAGVECVAVVFINAHANPAHELAAAELLRDAGFEGPVSLSHQVTGQYREYERTSTTVIDAYVRPAVSGYLNRLEWGLEQASFAGECMITTSAGGCVSFDEASSRPFETVMSGPVAGAVGAGTLCGELGIELAITADVGGTSFDTCLLLGGRPTVKYEGRVVGMPLQTPWVDVRSVGAGGGSIAYLDAGLLAVGPRSAGAVPGPVCYGRGGTEPTVTDAAVSLGMLARTTLASGLELDLVGARDALAGLGDELGLEPDDVARGVIQIAGASMAGAMRAVSIEVGQDPRDGALIAYGGAGPLFGTLLARELGIGTVVVPSHAGNFSAWGLLEQDMVRSAALTIVAPLGEAGLQKAEATLAQLFEQLRQRATNPTGGEFVHEAEFDLRYEGQEYSLAVPVPIADGSFTETAEQIRARFADAYERTYGHGFEHGVTIVSVRAIERTLLPRPSAAPPGGAANGAVHAGDAARPQRSGAYSFATEQWLEFEVLHRANLAPGSAFDGPAIVLEPTTTTYVDVGFAGRVDGSGALLLSDTTRREVQR